MKLSVALCSALLTAIAAGILHASGTPWHLASIGLVITFAVVVTGFLLTGSMPRDRGEDQPIVPNPRHSPRRVAVVTWLWAMVAYGIYAVGVNGAGLPDAIVSFPGTGIFLAMITIPLAMALVARTCQPRWRPWWFLGIILIIWAPFDSGLLAPVWPWPQGGAAYMLNVWISCVLALSAMHIAGAGQYFSISSFRIRPTRSDFHAIIRDQLWFTPVAIGFGFLTGFFAWNPKLSPFWQYPMEALGLYLTVALPEELLFRGLMQPILETFSWHAAIDRKRAARWATALIFGLSHLNNDPINDWRYVTLATVAGLAYANVYDRVGRRSLAAPALLHTGVDWLWSTFLRSI